MHSDEHMTHEQANRWLTSHGYLQETEQDSKDQYRNSIYTKFYNWLNQLLREDKRAAGIRAYIAGRKVDTEMLAIAPIGFYPTLDEVDVWLSTNEVSPELAEELKAPRSMAFVAESSIAFFYRTGYDRYARIKLRNVSKEMRETGKEITEDYIKKEKSIIWIGSNKYKYGYFAPSVESAESDHAIVVEGEFDALCLLSMCRRTNPGSIESIFCFGSGSTMEGGIDIITNLGIDDIYTFPDNDEPGIKYAFDIANEYPHTYVIKPEDYKPREDPADWAGRSTFDDLQTIFRGRIPAFSWIGSKLAEESVNGTLEEQSHVREKVVQLAKKLSPINREVFLKSFAPITGVSFESLVEEVVNSTAIHYRRILNTDGFGLQMSVTKNGKSNWEPISNCFIEIEKDILQDDGMEVERKFVLRIILVDKEIHLTISAKDFAADNVLYSKILDTAGSDVWIKPKAIQYIRDAASLLPSTGRMKTEELIYAHTGWRDGKFLMPNGYVDADGWHDLEDLKVQLPDNPTMFTRYKLDSPPADLSYIRDIIREDILKVFPYNITLPMIAHTFLPPLMAILDSKPYCLWLEGLTGSFKTAYTALLNSFWGDFRSGDFETWRSTPNALERIGNVLKDCPFVIDDYKKVDVSDRGLVSLIQSYADKHGRSRLKCTGEHQRTWPIRALLTATGEDSPAMGESSVMSRILLLKITSKGDSDRLTRGQLNAIHLPGIMAKYIQFLANKKWRDNELFNILIAKEKQFAGGHPRTAQVFATNSIAWDLFAEFLHCEDLSPAYYEGMKQTKDQSDLETQNEQAGSIFINTVKDLLDNGTHFLAGTHGEYATSHFDNAKCIGWIDNEFVYLLGSIALAEVNALRIHTVGSPIKYSIQAIYNQLLARNLIIPDKKGKPTQPKTIDGKRARVTVIRRDVFFDEETTYSAQHQEGEVWSEQGSVVLN